VLNEQQRTISRNAAAQRMNFMFAVVDCGLLWLFAFFFALIQFCDKMEETGEWRGRTDRRLGRDQSRNRHHAILVYHAMSNTAEKNGGMGFRWTGEW
jgi:hypothetical protein